MDRRGECRSPFQRRRTLSVRFRSRSGFPKTEAIHKTEAITMHLQGQTHRSRAKMLMLMLMLMLVLMLMLMLIFDI